MSTSQGVCKGPSRGRRCLMENGRHPVHPSSAFMKLYDMSRSRSQIEHLTLSLYCPSCTSTVNFSCLHAKSICEFDRFLQVTWSCESVSLRLLSESMSTRAIMSLDDNSHVCYQEQANSPVKHLLDTADIVLKDGWRVAQRSSF